MKRVVALMAAASVAYGSSFAYAEEPAAMPAAPAAQTSTEAPAAPAATATPAPAALPVASINADGSGLLPNGTRIVIALNEEVSSKNRRIGDKFVISLAEPIVVDGRVVVPAGTTGQGEVTFVSRAGMMGKGGELTLAARFLDYQGTQIPLRGLQLGGRGTDNTGAVIAATVLIGIGGVFITGGNMVLKPGTRGDAKVNAEVTIPANLVQAAPAPEAPALAEAQPPAAEAAQAGTPAESPGGSSPAPVTATTNP